MFVIPAIFPDLGRTNQSKTSQVAQFYHKTIVIDHYNIIIYYPLNFFYFHTCPCLISGECFSWPDRPRGVFKIKQRQRQIPQKAETKKNFVRLSFFISQSTVYLQFYMKTECRRRFQIPRRFR